MCVPQALIRGGPSATPLLPMRVDYTYPRTGSTHVDRPAGSVPERSAVYTATTDARRNPTAVSTFDPPSARARRPAGARGTAPRARGPPRWRRRRPGAARRTGRTRGAAASDPRNVSMGSSWSPPMRRVPTTTGERSTRSRRITSCPSGSSTGTPFTTPARPCARCSSSSRTSPCTTVTA